MPTFVGTIPPLMPTSVRTAHGHTLHPHISDLLMGILLGVNTLVQDCLQVHLNIPQVLPW